MPTVKINDIAMYYEIHGEGAPLVLIAGLNSELADLAVGWHTLAQPSQQPEDPATAQRRVTCGELAQVASQFTTGQGSLVQAIRTWEKWLEAFQKSGDPRQAAMAKTFARELTELQEASKSI